MMLWIILLNLFIYYLHIGLCSKDQMSVGLEQLTTHATRGGNESPFAITSISTIALGHAYGEFSCHCHIHDWLTDYSFVCSFVYSFIVSFIYAFIHIYSLCVTMWFCCSSCSTTNLPVPWRMLSKQKPKISSSLITTFCLTRKWESHLVVFTKIQLLFF